MLYVVHIVKPFTANVISDLVYKKKKTSLPQMVKNSPRPKLHHIMCVYIRVYDVVMAYEDIEISSYHIHVQNKYADVHTK